MKKNKGKKLALKKKAVRRLDPQHLEKAQGGTYGDGFSDGGYCVVEAYTDGCEQVDTGDCAFTLRHGGGDGNHNQHVAR